MLMRGLILPVALAVVLLSGCGKNEQSASQSERASSSSLPAAGDSAPSVQLKPGLWESSFEVEDIAFKGMPGGDKPMLDNMKSSMRRTAMRYCITPEAEARPNPDFLAAQKESHCTYKKMAMAGGTINADVVCEPEGQDRKSTRMKYSPSREHHLTSTA